MITEAWFETDEGLCIVCNESRSGSNYVFCREHADLFVGSPQRQHLLETYDDCLDQTVRLHARRKAWLDFANGFRKVFCLCGNERDEMDYLCVPCRESYAHAA